MAQLWHILRKDCRYLRFEFLLYALFLGCYTWTETQVVPATSFGREIFVPDTLRLLSAIGMMAVASYLIIRLIHAEAIPGDKQFWLTRPYSWKSLLGAKVLLLLIGVSLPMLAVRLLIFRIQGFPFYPGVWQLLWSQLVMTVVIGLAIAALAALTAGLVQFVIPALVLISVAAFVQEDAYWVNSWPAGTLWFRETLAAAGLIAIALWALHSQYRNRNTSFARGFALSAFTFVGILYFYAPWSLAMTVNGWLTAPMTDGSSPGVVLGPELKFYPAEPGDRVNGRLPISVRGIPAGYSSELQQILVTFRGPAGVKQEWFEPGPLQTSLQGLGYRAMGAVDRSFYDAAQGKPMTIRVSVDVILFPPVQTNKIKLSEDFVNVVGGVQCRGAILRREFVEQQLRSRSGRFDGIECRSAFDWPEVRSLLTPEAPFQPLRALVPSHSPFYKGALSLLSVQTQNVFFYRGVDETTITAQGPPQWYHRDFEFRNVRFGDTMDLH